MAINTQKLLPQSELIAKDTKTFVGKSSSIVISKKSQKNIATIRVKVIQIEKILKGTFALQKKELDNKKKSDSSKRREKIEERLETKPKPKAESGKIKMPSLPRMGFLDWVKNFIGNVILGYFAVRLVDHLPKIIPIVKFLGKATDFVLDVGGKLLDGLVTFIDWGYKAYDATRGFVKNLFGEGGVKQFDQLSGLLNQFLNLAIIAGMATAGAGGRKPGRGGGLGDGRPGRQPLYNNRGFRDNQGFTLQGERALNPSRGKSFANAHRDIMKRYFQRFGRDKFIQRFGEEGLEALPGGMQRGLLQRGARSGFMKIAGKGGAKAILGTVRPFLKRIPLPVIGALIDFGLSVALGENPGRAAFRAIGAGILATVGGGLAGVLGLAGGPLAVATAALGSIAGGTLGDMAGGALYDLFFGGKKPSKKSGKYAGGGVTRGGRSQGGVRRTLSRSKKGRYKRKLAPQKPGEVEATSPGADVGGEDKLFGLFPNPLKFLQKATDVMNPFKVIQKAGKNLGESDYFGPILSITSKILLGQKPTQQDYKNVGLGINMLVAKGIDDGKLKGGLAAFAEGGFVDPKTLDAIAQGGDISDWVARSFKDATESNAQKTLKEIQDNLKLKKYEKEKIETQKNDPNLEVGPGGVVTGGNADFWAMVAIASLENSNPQGQADVAQVLYNRLASGKYSGKSIKELVIAPGQFQPVREGDPKLWAAISDKQSAIAAVASHPRGKTNAARMVESAASSIQNSSLQKSAASFVGGRTDFSATGQYTPYPGAIGIVQRHGHDIGWFVGPGSIAYGKTNPGPAKAPQLGSIIVMGGGGALGAESVSNVDQFTPIAKRFGLTLTSSYRPGDPGYHGKNRARDYSNDAVGNGTPQQLAFAKHLAEKYGSSLTQLIYTPLGYGIANKKKVGLDYWGSSTNAQHYHHVHVAYEKGGPTLGRPHMAMLGEKGKEFVIDADSTAAIEGTFPGFLDAINKAKYSDAIKVLSNFAPYESGAEQTVVVPEIQMGDQSQDYDSSSSSGFFMSDGGEESDPFDILYQGG